MGNLLTQIVGSVFGYMSFSHYLMESPENLLLSFAVVLSLYYLLYFTSKLALKTTSRGAELHTSILHSLYVCISLKGKQVIFSTSAIAQGFICSSGFLDQTSFNNSNLSIVYFQKN